MAFVQKAGTQMIGKTGDVVRIFLGAAGELAINQGKRPDAPDRTLLRQDVVRLTDDRAEASVRRRLAGGIADHDVDRTCDGEPRIQPGNRDPLMRANRDLRTQLKARLELVVKHGADDTDRDPCCSERQRITRYEIREPFGQAIKTDVTRPIGKLQFVLPLVTLEQQYS